MKKLKAEIITWYKDTYSLYSVCMEVRGGSLETGTYKTKAYAKRSFISICNRLNITKDKYEFVEKTR